MLALAYCELRAPFSGWVVKRSVDLGSLVGPATNGFTLADTQIGQGSVRGARYFDRPGATGSASCHLHRFPAPAVCRRVSAISPAADPKSRVFSVEVTIANPKDQLKSGMIASLALNGEQLPAFGAGGSPLCGDTGSAACRQLRGDGHGRCGRSDRAVAVDGLGNTYGNMIAAKGGLAFGERVITTGVSLVKNGDKVRVIP